MLVSLLIRCYFAGFSSNPMLFYWFLFLSDFIFLVSLLIRFSFAGFSSYPMLFCWFLFLSDFILLVSLLIRFYFAGFSSYPMLFCWFLFLVYEGCWGIIEKNDFFFNSIGFGIFTCTSSSSSSYRAGSTDIPDPLSPLLPIVHRPR